jgi:hypothetical protein
MRYDMKKGSFWEPHSYSRFDFRADHQSDKHHS